MKLNFKIVKHINIFKKVGEEKNISKTESRKNKDNNISDICDTKGMQLQKTNKCISDTYRKNK